MKKIKVLVLITVMDRAGAETIMMNYLKNIDREKIQMDLMINRQGKADYESEIKKLGSKIYYISPIKPGSIIKYKKEFRQFLQKHPEYTIIHSNLEERSCFPLKIAKEMGIKTRIVHAHSVPKKQGIKQLQRIWCKKQLKGTYTHMFACSEGPAQWLYGKDVRCITMEEAVKKSGITKNKTNSVSTGGAIENIATIEKVSENSVIIMKNAVDTEKFVYRENIRKQQRKNLKVSEDTLVVGHIGRLVPEKNQLKLIEIFGNVNNQRPDSRLLLIGGGKSKREQKYKKQVQKKIKEYGLESKVRWLGVRDDIDKLLHAIDVLVMPSTSEGFPVTLVEAQALGTREVVSDVIDYKVNVTEELQYQALDGDVEDWANKIISFSHTTLDREKMHQMVKDKGFDIKDNAKQLEAFYESCAK